MIAYYTANLAAFLTVSRRVPPIKGWEDLLHSDIEYGSLNSGSTKGFFLHTRLEPFRSMGRRMVQNPHWFADSVQNGVDRVWRSKGKYAFVLESLMNEYYNNRDPCDTMMVGEPFGNNGYGIALPRKSPFKEEISLAIARLREAQVLFSLRKKWWIERGQCNDVDEQSSSEALALINVAGVFYILTVGLILALITSLVELRLHQHRLRRPQLPSDGSHALISHVHIHSPKKVICNKILPTQNIEHSLTSKGLEEKNHLNRESAEIHSSNPSQLRWNPKRSLCTPLNWTRRYLRGGGVAISKANDNRVTGNESDDPARFSTIRNSTITLATELNRSIVGETGNYDFQNHPASEAKLSTSCLIHSTGVINLLAQKQGLIINGEDI
ncbi:unnamed protein product [Protopolystoma xenopodis]|uniref:Ionotropic glutamate receptor C-terminal domain-containing protein n=1 Tax=Protopolystoma xenopodis TaxID=117903 RepID=A0A3S5CV64_9PLAT|nr:unnamed protein product [Protopolystoma xenopodis]